MRAIIPLFVFLSVSYAFASDQVLKICLTGSTEKAIPKYGDAFVKGSKLAIDQLPEILKKKVQLEVHYYESTPLAPIDALEKMRAAACDAIIGFSTGNDLLAIEQNLKSQPILILSIYGDPQPSFNKTSYLRTMQPAAKDLVNYLFQKIPTKPTKSSKILMVTAVDRSEMQTYRNAYLENLKEVAPMVTSVDVMEQTHDLSKLIETLAKDSGWDYVILLTRSLIAAEISDKVYSSPSNQKAIILGTKYFGSTELPAFFNYLKNKNINAFFARQNCSCDTSKKYLSFKEMYKKHYSSTPMSISSDAFDATNFILKGLGIPKITAQSLRGLLFSDLKPFKGITSFTVQSGLKVSSNRRFLVKVDKNGYNEVK